MESTMTESLITQTSSILDDQNLKFPLFTGQFNGFGVEVKSANEMSLLYQWNFFGKGSFSRSKPRMLRNKDNCEVLRKRQFFRREEWFRKFSKNVKSSNNDKNLQNDISSLITDIKGSKEGSKDVIDLVSSDEEMEEPNDSAVHICEENLAMVVPNSDSEGEDYFKDFKPKCCFNKVKINETLVLSLQEAYFLSYAFGCLQIIDLDENPLSLEQAWKLFTETEDDFVPKYIVFHYFRTKGYIVKPGIKYGGDYLLYKEGPGNGHADYIVIIKYESTNQINSWLPMLGHIRMAGTTSKEILMTEIIPRINYPEKNLIQPQDLSCYRVRETVWNKRIPYNQDYDD